MELYKCKDCKEFIEEHEMRVNCNLLKSGETYLRVDFNKAGFRDVTDCPKDFEKDIILRNWLWPKGKG